MVLDFHPRVRYNIVHAFDRKHFRSRTAGTRGEGGRHGGANAPRGTCDGERTGRPTSAAIRPTPRSSPSRPAPTGARYPGRSGHFGFPPTPRRAISHDGPPPASRRSNTLGDSGGGKAADTPGAFAGRDAFGGGGARGTSGAAAGWGRASGASWWRGGARVWGSGVWRAVGASDASRGRAGGQSCRWGAADAAGAGRGGRVRGGDRAAGAVDGGGVVGVGGWTRSSGSSGAGRT